MIATISFGTICEIVVGAFAAGALLGFIGGCLWRNTEI